MKKKCKKVSWITSMYLTAPFFFVPEKPVLRIMEDPCMYTWMHSCSGRQCR